MKDDVKVDPADDRPAPVEIDHDDLEKVIGSYSQDHPKNDWHIGTITVEKRSEDGKISVLKWTNKAGRSWLLYPDLKTASLKTGDDNPYHKRARAKAFYIAFDKTKPNAPRLAGFWFQGALFIKTVAKHDPE